MPRCQHCRSDGLQTNLMAMRGSGNVKVSFLKTWRRRTSALADGALPTPRQPHPALKSHPAVL